MGADRLQARSTRLFIDADDLRRFTDDQRRIVQRCEIEEPDAVWKLVDQFGSRLDAQPRLAESAHANQRHHARLAEKLLDLVEFLLAAHERRALVRQVVRDVPDRQPPLAHLHDPEHLFRIGGRAESGVRLANFEELERVDNALDHPVPVRDDLEFGLAEVLASLGRQQDLPAARERHHTCGGRLGEALDFNGLGAERDVCRAVLAQRDRPDVYARARLQRNGQPREGVVIGERVRNSIGRTIEQHQHAVGLVDLAAPELRQQVARHAVVGRPHLRHRLVADRLGELRAVDDVGQEQRAYFAHRETL